MLALEAVIDTMRDELLERMSDFDDTDKEDAATKVTHDKIVPPVE